MTNSPAPPKKKQKQKTGSGVSSFLATKKWSAIIWLPQPRYFNVDRGCSRGYCENSLGVGHRRRRKGGRCCCGFDTYFVRRYQTRGRWGDGRQSALCRRPRQEQVQFWNCRVLYGMFKLVYTWYKKFNSLYTPTNWSWPHLDRVRLSYCWLTSKISRKCHVNDLGALVLDRLLW